MSIHPVMQRLAAKLQRTDLPNFGPGDTVRVQVKIKEGDKERVQAFEGIADRRKNGAEGSFTVRKISFWRGRRAHFPPCTAKWWRRWKKPSAGVRCSKLSICAPGAARQLVCAKPIPFTPSKPHIASGISKAAFPLGMRLLCVWDHRFFVKPLFGHAVVTSVA